MKLASHLCLGAVALLAMQHPVWAQTIVAGGSAHQATITSVGEGPFFRLDLPVTLYPTAAHVDLRDVRIRNANGDLLPHAWLNSATTKVETLSGTAPFYPIAPRKSGKANWPADVSLQFRQNPDGSLLTLNTRRPLAGKEKSDVIIDVSQIKGDLLQARFKVDDSAEGLFPLIVEASDDLGHWRTISSDGQLAVLKRQGGRIEKLTLDLYGCRAKFLRLRWQEPARAIAIKSVTIDSVQQDEVTAPLQWSAPIQAVACAADYCDYLLPANTPLDSLRVNLSEPNTLAAITVAAQLPAPSSPDYQQRHHPLYVLRHKRQPPAVATAPAAEVTLAQTVAYRLKQANGEVRSENLALDGGVYPRLRIRTEGPISLLGQSAPTIAVASAPRSLLFLGRGTGPFTLHWGVADPQGKALSLSTLVPGYQPGKPVQAAVASVSIPLPDIRPETLPLAKAAPGKPSQINKKWLWAALGGGLLLLAGMAWSLFRSMAKPEE